MYHLITDCIVKDRCYAIERNPTLAEVKDFSAREKGKIWRGNYYIVHDRGVNTRVYLLSDYVNPVCQTRNALLEIIGEDTRIGFTYSNMARACMTWLGLSQYPIREVGKMLPNWHYQRCLPADVEYGELFDLKGAYWQFVDRCKSPLLQISSQGKILWVYISQKSEDRWHQLKEYTRENKQLRLAMVGANCAGWQGYTSQFHGTSCYYRGEAYRPAGNYLAPLQPLAMVSVMSTAEVCSAQAKACHSCYSNADSCLIEGGAIPQYWEDCGLEYRVKDDGFGNYARGDGDVRAIGAYRIGNYETKPYRYFLQADIDTPYTTPSKITTDFHKQLCF